MREYELLEKLKSLLEDETPLRQFDLTNEQEHLIRGYQFLTLKPLIVVVNIDENDLGQESQILERFNAVMQQKNTVVLPISAEIEMEIQQLAEDEAEMFRKDLGIDHSAMDKLIRTSYQLLEIGRASGRERV